jgi:hypothetical protein
MLLKIEKQIINSKFEISANPYGGFYMLNYNSNSIYIYKVDLFNKRYI